MLDHGTQFSVAKANGFVLPDGARVLDLGCGNGSGVAALLALGYEAVGCDLRLRKSGPHRDRLYREGRLRVMESPRRLPFDDETFDGVFSQNVLEHVQDYEATLSEIARVLKPNGVSVHMFPSCWTLVEGHVHVPLATFFRPYWYLLLWAWVGVRKRSQNGWSAIRTARHNRWYLTTATNYLSGRRIMARLVAAADLPYPDNAGGASAAYESTGVRVCLTLRTADPTTTAAQDLQDQRVPAPLYRGCAEPVDDPGGRCAEAPAKTGIAHEPRQGLRQSVDALGLQQQAILPVTDDLANRRTRSHTTCRVRTGLPPSSWPACTAPRPRVTRDRTAMT